jgi:hypothetical protein
MLRRGLVLALSLASATAAAGTVVGRVDLPPVPERPPLDKRGFLDRIDNPLAPPQNIDIRHHLVIVVEGDDKPAAPAAIQWDLVGESFARPVIAAPAGAEVSIRNMTKLSRRLKLLDGDKDTKLLDAAPINPKPGTKSFRPSEVGKVYTVVSPDAPYFKGTVVVVNTSYIGYIDDNNRFEITDVPDGNYKLRVYVSLAPSAVAGGREGWVELDNGGIAVRVTAKGKSDVNVKLPTSAFAPAKK